jgi:integrase
VHDRRVDEIAPADVAELVGTLHAAGKARETIRKTVTVLAMIFDHADVTPNPARDRIRVRLPREDRPEIQPPSADHVEAVYRLLRPATGCRCSSWTRPGCASVSSRRSPGAISTSRGGRWRVSQAVAKTRYGRWISVPPGLFEAVPALCPRDDRHPDRRVFENVTADRLRTAISRACTAAGVPVFSPHDLRHRRISLLHLGGVPWATIGQAVGQRDLAVTANTYSHVLTDERELDY